MVSGDMQVPGGKKTRLSILYTIFISLAFLGAATILVAHVLNSSPGVNRSDWQVIRPPHDVESLAIQGDIVWAGGTEGVTGIDRSTGKATHELPCNPSPANVQALLLDRNGTLWIGSDEGLIRYDGGTCTYFRTEQGLPSNHILSLLQDRQGRLWVGTPSGAAVTDNGRWQVITTADGLMDDMVRTMLEDSRGGLWFGSYVAPSGGISHLGDGAWQYFSISNGLPHNDINALMEDRDGSVWAGTGFYDRGGAARFTFNGSAWSIAGTLTVGDGLAGPKVRSIFQDSSGSLWFGSEYDGIARLRYGVFRVYSDKNGLSSQEVKCMVQDRDGNLWMGTKDGITRIPAKVLAAIT